MTADKFGDAQGRLSLVTQNGDKQRVARAEPDRSCVFLRRAHHILWPKKYAVHKTVIFFENLTNIFVANTFSLCVHQIAHEQSYLASAARAGLRPC